MGFPCSSVGKKNLPAVQETQVQFLGWEDPLEKEMQPTPVSLPWKSHGHRSLVRCSLWGRKELGTTEWLTLISTYTIQGFLKKSLNLSRLKKLSKYLNKHWYLQKQDIKIKIKKKKLFFKACKHCSYMTRKLCFC